MANATAFQRNTEIEHYYNMPYIDYEMTCPWRHAGKRRKDAVIRRLLPTFIFRYTRCSSGMTKRRMLTGPDFGLVRTTMLPKLKAFWVVTVPDISENRGAFILLSPQRRRQCGAPKLAQRSDISENANLQDMRRQTVADTWRDELIHSSTMKMEVSGFPKISYSKNIPRWQKYLASSAMTWNRWCRKTKKKV